MYHMSPMNVVVPCYFHIMVIHAVAGAAGADAATAGECVKE